MKAHLLIAVALVLAGPPAHAQTRVQETVGLSDLNLRTAQGQANAKRRIRAAASRVCAQPRTPVLPRAAAYAWRCRKAVQARAEAELVPQARSYATVSD